MIATAIIIGFFSAVGWWGGNKATSAIDAAFVVQPAKCATNEERNANPSTSNR